MTALFFVMLALARADDEAPFNGTFRITPPQNTGRGITAASNSSGITMGPGDPIRLAWNASTGTTTLSMRSAPLCANGNYFGFCSGSVPSQFRIKAKDGGYRIKFTRSNNVLWRASDCVTRMANGTLEMQNCDDSSPSQLWHFEPSTDIKNLNQNDKNYFNSCYQQNKQPCATNNNFNSVSVVNPCYYMERLPSNKTLNVTISEPCTTVVPPVLNPNQACLSNQQPIRCLNYQASNNCYSFPASGLLYSREITTFIMEISMK